MELCMRHSLLKMYAYNNLHLESIALQRPYVSILTAIL